MRKSIQNYPYQWIIGIIITFIGSFFTVIVSGTNLVRDVQENTIGIEGNREALKGITEIREGLIAAGIIKPINQK